MSLRPSIFRGEMRLWLKECGYNSKIISQDEECMFLIIDGIYVTIIFPTIILTYDHWKCGVSLFYPKYMEHLMFNPRDVGQFITAFTSFKENCESQ